jgi:hypothetical protein
MTYKQHFQITFTSREKSHASQILYYRASLCIIFKAEKFFTQKYEQEKQ